ncbi:hypothetical protein ABFP60_08395 [Clostridioides difficile]
MRIENGIKGKVDVIDVSNNINQYLNIMLQQENDKEAKTTTTNQKTKQDIYATIRTKANIISSDQRDIQDKISLIQSQEQKIETIENTLKYTKNEYIQAIQNGKKEEVKQKIKIKQLSRQINTLKNQSNNKESKIEEINDNKEEYLQGEEKIVSRINEILQKINTVKSRISQYKSELIALSQEIQSNKAKIKMQENELQKHLDDSDYIINGVSINKYNYVDLKGNISTGIVIDIYI